MSHSLCRMLYMYCVICTYTFLFVFENSDILIRQCLPCLENLDFVFVISFNLIRIIFTGLDPTFECYEKNASSAAKPLINKCINNDPQECRISYTSEYKSFASEVCK